MTAAPSNPRDRAEAMAERLRSLAAPARLLILQQLQAGEAAVGDLERMTGLKQPGLSQQLAELRQAGWVATRREARSVVYRLADARTDVLLTALQALLFDGDGVERLAAALGATPSKKAPSPAIEAAVFAVTGHAA